ncbi:hypothetical protein [Terribacillus sp. DMT04]|uniref:hypothetical protein n=1 Tax=Terribacillus sp. DMT04 TaxID=2850441 RepID=UPI001C2CAE26|nr:hypothetical protein [Terribacillus sp. DMT04]QXE01909.1 hypothetical protein KS242_01175 [Terribacillus sp. DMT04]
MLKGRSIVECFNIVHSGLLVVNSRGSFIVIGITQDTRRLAALPIGWKQRNPEKRIIEGKAI